MRWGKIPFVPLLVFIVEIVMKVSKQWNSIVIENVNYKDNHKRTGPVSFRGAEVSCPNILSIDCPKIKWFCPNITWFFFFFWASSLQILTARINLPNTPFERETPRHQIQSNNSKNKRISTLFLYFQYILSGAQNRNLYTDTEDLRANCSSSAAPLTT